MEHQIKRQAETGGSIWGFMNVYPPLGCRCLDQSVLRMRGGGCLDVENLLTKGGVGAGDWPSKAVAGDLRVRGP